MVIRESTPQAMNGFYGFVLLPSPHADGDQPLPSIGIEFLDGVPAARDLSAIAMTLFFAGDIGKTAIVL